METIVANIAVGRVTLMPAKPGPDNPAQLILYHTSLSLIEKLVADGVLNPADYKKSVSILNKKYGLSSGSIFAESA